MVRWSTNRKGQDFVCQADWTLNWWMLGKLTCEAAKDEIVDNKHQCPRALHAVNHWQAFMQEREAKKEQIGSESENGAVRLEMHHARFWLRWFSVHAPHLFDEAVALGVDPELRGSPEPHSTFFFHSIEMRSESEDPPRERAAPVSGRRARRGPHQNCATCCATARRLVARSPSGADFRVPRATVHGCVRGAPQTGARSSDDMAEQSSENTAVRLEMHHVVHHGAARHMKRQVLALPACFHIRFRPGVGPFGERAALEGHCAHL